jgi:4'-phosphopantetheinyl transferase
MSPPDANWPSLLVPLEPQCRAAEWFPDAWGVQVWQAWLGEDAASDDAALASMLSDDEVRRANQFVFAKDRRRFLRCRAALRLALAWALDASPSCLEFAYGPQGKPELASLSESGLKFNVAHSGDWALVAVARKRRVGIDVEQIRPALSREIAWRNFAPREAAALETLPPEEFDETFFRCWTRKEAYLKALGCGLSLPLDSFEVSLAAAPAAILWSRDDPEVQTRWRMAELRPAAGYVAALVVEAALPRNQARGDWHSTVTGVRNEIVGA